MLYNRKTGSLVFPNPGTPLDLSQPLAKGLLFYPNLHEQSLYDVISRSFGTTFGSSVAVKDTPRGPTLGTSNTTNTGVAYPFLNSLAFQGTTNGPRNPGTTSNNSSSGDVPWSNPGNVVSANSSYATATVDPSDPITPVTTTQYIFATNFGFSVSGTITGILVEVKGFRNVGGDNTACYKTIQLLNGTSLIGSNFGSTSILLPTTNIYTVFGGAGSTWSASPTSTSINSSNFGVAIQAECTNGATDFSIDHVRITVFTDGQSYVGTSHSIAGWWKIDGAASGSTLISLPWNNGTWVSPFSVLSLTRSTTTASLLYSYADSTGTQYSAGASTNTYLIDSKWHHIACVRNGSTVNYYLDGSLKLGSSVGTNNIPDWLGHQQPITINNNSSSDPLNSTQGQVFGLGFWGRSLSAQEVQLLYTSPDILYWTPRKRYFQAPISTFTGSSSLSTSTTFAASGTRVVPVYTGSSTLSKHPTLVSSETYAFSDYNAVSSLSKHPTIISPQQGLVGYWKFDDTGSGVFSDYSGQGNNGSVTGTVVKSTDKPPLRFSNSHSLLFNGDGTSCINIPAPLESKQYTYSMWVKFDTVSNYAIWQKTNGGSDDLYGYALRLKLSTTLGYYVFEHYIWTSLGYTVSGTDQVLPNQWYHVAIVCTGTDGLIKLYVNGNLIGSNNIVGDPQGTLTTYNVGLSQYDFSAFTGRLDDVQFYNLALPDAYIGRLATGIYPFNTTIVPVFNGSSAINKHPSILSSNTGSAPVYTGSSSLSKHPTFSNVGSFGPKRTGTASLSVHPTTGGAYDGLVGYWKFDFGNATDYSGQGKDGTVNGSVTDVINTPLVQFTDPGSLHFPGDGTSYVNIPDTFNPTAYTYSMWVYVNALAEVNIWTRTNDSGPLVAWTNQLRIRRFGSYFFEHFLYTSASNGYSLRGNTAITLGAWYHVAITCSGNNGNIKLFVNGSQDGSPVNILGVPSTLFNKYNVGIASNGFGGFNGLVDDVQFYNRELTSSEITNLSSGKYPLNTFSGVVVFGRSSIVKHPTFASAGVRGIPVYTANSTLSKTVRLNTFGTRGVPVYTANSTPSKHPTFSAAGIKGLPVYHGTFAKTTHPTIAGSGVHIPTLNYQATSTLQKRLLFAAGSGSIPAIYTGTADLSNHPSIDYANTYMSPAITDVSLVFQPTLVSKGHSSAFPSSLKTVPLYIQGAEALANTSVTLYINGLGHITNTIPLYTVAIGFQTESLDLFLKANPVPNIHNSIPLIIDGSLSNTGVFKIAPLYIRGEALHEALNLFMRGKDSGRLAEPVNLYIRGGNKSIDGYTPLFIQNNASTIIKQTPLFIKGAGHTAGALSTNETLMLFIQREGNKNGITLFIENKGLTNTLPLIIRGSPKITDTTTLFIQGFGDDINNTITLFVSGKVATGINKSTDLVIPNVVGVVSNTTPLYTHGFNF